MARLTKVVDGVVEVKVRKNNIKMNDFLGTCIKEIMHGKRSIVALTKKLDRGQVNIDDRLCKFLEKNEDWYDGCAKNKNTKDGESFFTELSTKEAPEVNYSDWKDKTRGARGLTLDMEVIFSSGKNDDDKAVNNKKK